MSCFIQVLFSVLRFIAPGLDHVQRYLSISTLSFYIPLASSEWLELISIDLAINPGLSPNVIHLVQT